MIFILVVYYGDFYIDFGCEDMNGALDSLALLKPRPPNCLGLLEDPHRNHLKVYRTLTTTYWQLHSLHGTYI